jgi:chitinase
VYDYKKLPIGQEYIDNITVSAYSYDETQRLLISYDSPETVKTKINYIKSKNLGGVMSWSIDSDVQTTSNRSLSNVIFSELTNGNNLQITANKIKFKNSTYINIKNDNFTDIYRSQSKNTKNETKKN